jgi:large subunit ribosomal protein L13
MKKLIYDAENAIVGRMGTVVAKELLRGNEVIIINAEKAIITGNRQFIIAKVKKLRKKGGSSTRGPIISKLPERLLKRMIRGMLPWDRTKGREAWRRLTCYEGNGELKEADLKNAVKFEHNPPFKFTTIKQITDLL